MASAPEVPEYIRRFLHHRGELTVFVSAHAQRPRPRQRPITSAQVFALVTSGHVDDGASREFPDRPYDKYAVYLYFADELRTLKAILTVNWSNWFCQVESLWSYPGRQFAGRSSQKGDSQHER